jgi:hypothetical protein
MVSLKEAVDRPTSPPGHVYFSLSDEEIPSDESIDIRLEKDESMIGGTPLLMDIPSGISCHLLLNLLDDALCMLKYIHTYICISKISLSHDLALLLLAQKIVEKNFRLHVQVGICVNCKQNYVGERERG